MICEICHKECIKASNRQQYCERSKVIIRKEYMDEYSIGYRRINKERIKESDKKRSTTKERRERHLKDSIEYNKKPEGKFKNKIRNRTRYKYGKLPKGFEYHHPKPYNVDVWLGVHYTEHQQIEKEH